MSPNIPQHGHLINRIGLQTNARLLTYADPTAKPWNATANGATIQKTVDFLMTTDPATHDEQDIKAEIYPNIAAIASVYGDPDGKYVKFLKATGFPYADDATFLWDQPLAGGDASANSSSSPDPESSRKGGASSSRVGAVGRACFLTFILLAFGLELW
jgi:hypothetical protein